MSAPARGVVAAAAVLAAVPAVAAKGKLGPGERIDLNRATVSELMRLPGLGQKRAQGIVAHRQKRPFRRIEDVTAVKGLGPAWFRKAKGNLTVTGAVPPSPAAPAASASAGAGPGGAPAATSTGERR